MNAADNKYFTKELIQKAQNDDKAALSDLVVRNTPLVNSLLKKYLQFSYDYDDLFQIGVIGLIKAIKRFDFSYDTQFSTYAVYVINGELKRYLRDDGFIKVSRNLRSVYIKARSYIETCIKNGMDEPSVFDIAKNIGESYETVLSSLDACRTPEYLQDKISNSDEKSKLNEDMIASSNDDIPKMLDMLSVKNAISSLDADARKIITLRYFKSMTQSKVAQIMGISQVQVSRMEKKILKKIKSEFI